jgi:hypothetical protein
MLGAFIALPNDLIDLGNLIGGNVDRPSEKLAVPTTSNNPSTSLLPGLPTEEPAPITTTASGRTAPQQQVEQPAQDPVTTKPVRAGALIITIKMGSGGKIGPAEYRSGATPGANVDVFDDKGQLNSGCYPSWTLYREEQAVRTNRNSRCTSGGVTMFNFDDSLKPPGSYRLDVAITTDSGQSGSSSVDFTVS